MTKHDNIASYLSNKILSPNDLPWQDSSVTGFMISWSPQSLPQWKDRTGLVEGKPKRGLKLSVAKQASQRLNVSTLVPLPDRCCLLMLCMKGRLIGRKYSKGEFALPCSTARMWGKVCNIHVASIMRWLSHSHPIRLIRASPFLIKWRVMASLPQHIGPAGYRRLQWHLPEEVPSLLLRHSRQTIRDLDGEVGVGWCFFWIPIFNRNGIYS